MYMRCHGGSSVTGPTPHGAGWDHCVTVGAERMHARKLQKSRFRCGQASASYKYLPGLLTAWMYVHNVSHWFKWTFLQVPMRES